MAVPIVYFCIMLGAAGIILPSKSPKRKIAVFSLSHGDEEADETFTLNHLPKAGGTFLQKVINASLKDSPNIEVEDYSLTSEDVSNTFVVGLIRNPFDWYISLWSYGSSRHGQFRFALSGGQRDRLYGDCRAPRGLCPGRVWGASRDDQERFRQWVRLVNHEEMGLLTYRFFFSYVSQPSYTKHYTLVHTARYEVEKDSSLLDRMEHGYKVAKRQICWVHTENLVNDARSCLQEYERQYGRGEVNWQRFGEAVANSNHNPTSHATCGTFYDQDTIDYVLKSDKHVFEAFNRYVGQCQP